MTTLLAVYTSDGCVGQCDAKCYNAEGPECSCICCGMNHGVGLIEAIKIIDITTDVIRENYAPFELVQEFEILINTNLVNQLWFPFIDEEE